MPINLKSEVVESKIENIFITLGRTGKINFNASLLPVRLAGSIVKKATLHNYDYIKSLDIRINDYVNVKKAGDIIPKVLSVNLNKRNSDSEVFNEPTACSFCNQKLKRFSDEVDLYCVNKNCVEIHIQQIIYYTSKAAMDIENLGTQVVRKFFEANLIKDISDIYLLKDNKEQIINMEGFSDKSFNNLIKSIEDSKNKSLENLITGLGIKHIGKVAAKTIAKNLEVLNLEKNDISEIRGIGTKMINAWKEWFIDTKNLDLLKNLQVQGLNFKYWGKRSQSNQLDDKSFVITGKLSRPRKFYVDLIEEHNGKVVAAISKMTTYLIAGSDAGSKLNKAKKLNVKVLNEEEFLNLLN